MWAKDLHTYLPKEDKQLENKHMKIWLIAFVIGKMTKQWVNTTHQLESLKSKKLAIPIFGDNSEKKEL